MTQPEKLAAMAGQAAGFFRTQQGDQAAALANHLRRFWTPAMCAALFTYVEAGGPVDSLVSAAVKGLHTPTAV